jgi:hypothetical protein
MLKKITLAAAAMVVIGIVGLAITVGTNARGLHQYVTSIIGVGSSGHGSSASYNFDKTKTIDGQAVKSIQVTASAASIHIYPGGSKEIVAHAYGHVAGVKPADFTFTVQKNADGVVVSLKQQPNLTIFDVINLNLDVEVPQHLYDTLSADSSAGKLTVADLQARHITLHASAGSVEATHLAGQIQATSSAGSVTVTDIKGNVDLNSSGGSVLASNIAGDIQAHSSAGMVEIHLLNITHNISARSTGGGVHITTEEVPSALRFNLRTFAGNVNFALPNPTYTVYQRSNLQGSLGQGGPDLRVQSSAGSVDVTQAPLS